MSKCCCLHGVSRGCYSFLAWFKLVSEAGVLVLPNMALTVCVCVSVIAGVHRGHCRGSATCSLCLVNEFIVFHTFACAYVCLQMLECCTECTCMFVCLRYRHKVSKSHPFREHPHLFGSVVLM